MCRCMTGENWNVMMRDAAVEPPYCDSGDPMAPNRPNTCGSPRQSILFFVLFYFVCSFLLLNMVVAVILK
jgi:hypothetical protein